MFVGDGFLGEGLGSEGVIVFLESVVLLFEVLFEVGVKFDGKLEKGILKNKVDFKLGLFDFS